MSVIKSLSLCARVTIDMHSLNNEGTEGNQQMTRMVHIIDQKGDHQVVNAISGDMLKHILVEHLTPLLADSKQPLSPAASEFNPDRILLDKAFLEFAKDKAHANDAVLGYMLQNCAVTDIAGALYAERAVARKSCVEFGWVVGLPESTVTEQYFHVKYDPGRGKAAGGESVQGKQAIFHRPASSGIYALVCNLDLGRIGLNDITRKDEIDAKSKKLRGQSLVRALAASLVHPTGAQRNTQAPHILACEGIVTWSGTSLPAPALSPLQDGYETQIEQCVKALGGIEGADLQCKRFASMAGALELLTGLAAKLDVDAGGSNAPQAKP